MRFAAQHDPSSADTSAGFHYAYSCSNGDLSGATYGGSGAADSAPCTFADNGTYTVKGRIIDKDGGFNEYMTDVTVKNLPPVVTAAADQTGDEGTAKSFDLGSFSDPGVNDNPWKVHVDWGDTTSSDPGDRSAQGALGSTSHTFADHGTYTVKVTVTDKDGASGDASFKVVVSNLPPVVIAAADQTADEGSAKSFDLGSCTAPDASDNTGSVHVELGDTTS